MKQRILRMAAMILAIAMVCSTALATAGEARGFTDVPASHWAYESIQRAAVNGWVRGTSEGVYSPADSVTNSAFLTVLTRAFYPKDVENAAINGVGGDWWEPYCSAAALNGLPQGTAIGDVYYSSYKWDKDLLSAPISRYDMAQMMLNYLSNNKLTVSEREKKEAQAKIGDWGQIPVEYRDAVSSVYALGVISGTSAGTFDGARGMTRAEMAVVLCRLADATGKGTTPAPEPTPTPTPEPTPTPKPAGSYAPADVNQDGVLTEDEVYQALMAFKEEVPAETPWESDKYYQSPVGGRTYGCAAFAYQASDKAFGNLPERVVSDINNLRVGDLFCNKTSSSEHWGIVTGLGEGEYFHTAEGSVNGVVTWTGLKSYSSFEKAIALGTVTFYTRYPQ